MTADQAENAAAAAAQARGEAAETKHMADARAQHEIGSTVAIEPAQTPDDVAIAWPGSSAGEAAPSLRPTEPRPVGQQRQHDGPPPA